MSIAVLKRRVPAVVLTALIATAIFLFPGSVLGISTYITADRSSYLLGELVNFTGSVTFDEGETKNLESVTLVVQGNQGVTKVLPVAEGTYDYPNDNLSVIVSWTDIDTVPGYGGHAFGYRGTSGSSQINYAVIWDAPMVLDPAPSYTLVPNTTSLFDIPQLSAPTLPSGLPAPLPAVTTGFDLPALAAVDPNAPDPLPNLVALPNQIPLNTTATVGAPTDLPESGEITDTVGSIPTVTDDLISGVASMPSSTSFATGLGTILGMDRDQNGNIYVLSDAGGSSSDTITKLDSSGAVVSAFGTSGVESIGLSQARAIGYANSTLWVTHGQSGLDVNNKRLIFQYNATTGAQGDGCTFSINGPGNQTLDPLTGADNQYLWGVTEDDRTIRLDATDDCGAGLSQSQSRDRNLNYNVPTAMAAYGDSLWILSTTGTIHQIDPQNPGDIEANVTGTATGYTSGLGGFVIDSSGVYYLASNSGGTIVKTQGSSSITTSPRGLAYDSVNNHFYLLVNGSGGNDRMLVLDSSGAVVSGKDSIDTGTEKAEGLAYLSGSIYIQYSDNENNAKMKAYNISGASLGNEISVTTQGGGTEYKASTSDGSTIFGFDGAGSRGGTFDTSGDSDENIECNNNCDTINSGADSAAYHSIKSSYYLAKNNDIALVAALNGNQTSEAGQYTNLTYNSTNLKIRGMAIVGNVLYMADDGGDQILKASIPTGETINPTALTSDGTHLWVVTNGTSGSDTLLKLNASTGAKVAGYSLSRNDIEGITYMGNYLWVLGVPENGGCKLQKIDPSDGTNVGSAKTAGNWCDNAGGLSNDGTLLMITYTGQGRVISYDTNGNQDTEANIQGWDGARALAYNATNSQYWMAKGAKIDAFATGGCCGLEQVSGMETSGLLGNGSNPLQIKGMTWVGAVLYIADDETDYLYKTAAPAGANDILGLADDGTDLYVLVNNTPNDSIMKVSTSGTKDTSWGTNGVVNTGTSDASSITVHGANLWVAGLTQEGQSQWNLYSYRISDGASVSDFSENNVPFGNAQPNGLMSDGTSIFIGHTQMSMNGMPGYDEQGNSSGTEINLSGTTTVQGLAYRSSSPEILAATSSSIKTFSAEGSAYDEYFPQVLSNIKGITTIGYVVYIGDAGGNTITKASIPLPASTITTEPKALTENGTDLFVVIEASPKDYIAKLTTAGALVTAFGTGGSVQAPKDDISGITYLNDALWILTSAPSSCPPSCNGADARVYKLNKDTGVAESNFDISNCNYGPCMDFNAMTNNGTQLLVGASEYCGQNCGEMKIIQIDPNNTNTQTETNMNGAPDSIDSMTFFGVPVNNNVFTFTGNMLRKFTYSGNDLDAQGNMALVGQHNIAGSAYMGTNMYLAGYEFDNNANKNVGYVDATTLTANIPELTTVGSYAAKLVSVIPGVSSSTLPASTLPASTLPASTVPTATPSAAVTVTSSAVNFTIEKATSTTVSVIAPLSGFSVFDSAMSITGTVNDPSVETISVGVDLPFTSLLSDGAEDNSVSAAKFTASGLWNLACKASTGGVKTADGDCSWYYGNTSAMNYDTGNNSGALLFNDSINVISDDIQFKFDTWWDTEPGADYDRKLVQVSEDNGGSWTNLAGIIGPYDIDPNTGKPWSVPSPLAGIQQWLPVNQADSAFSGNVSQGNNCAPYCDPMNQGQQQQFSGGDPKFNQVVIDLSAYVGKTIKIRFLFDTMDASVNAMEGWYVDNIDIGGAGFDGVTAPVTAVSDAAVKATGVYGTFSTTFNLAEGINTITVSAQNPYNTTLNDSAQIQGFLDTTAPNITMSGIASPTSSAIATVAGTIADINFKELTIQHTSTLGTKTIVTVKALPGDGTFTKVAGLVEGINTFKATATDGAGLTASSTVSVVLDTVGPVLTVNTPSYPIGASSARQGEPVIFSVDATATGAGVDKVEILFPTAGNTFATGRFQRSSDVPDAILDLWGVSGEYILATKIPDEASPGTYGLTIKAYDTAGNVTTGTVEAAVVASLEAYNINLMPDWNLVSLPLMPTTPDINTMTTGVSGIQSIWYYDASMTLAAGQTASDRWLSYTPDLTPNDATDDDVDTLTSMNTGKGYWFKMDPTAFTLSSPLGPGLPHTPQAIKLTYSGQFVEPGTLPPSYNVVSGWNAMGFHSENELPVTTALQSLESPQRIWGSLLQYNNRIVVSISDVPGEGPNFEILLGAFQRILPTENLIPGYGYWIFMVNDGIITP